MRRLNETQKSMGRLVIQKIEPSMLAIIVRGAVRDIKACMAQPDDLVAKDLTVAMLAAIPGWDTDPKILAMMLTAATARLVRMSFEHLGVDINNLHPEDVEFVQTILSATDMTEKKALELLL